MSLWSQCRAILTLFFRFFLSDASDCQAGAGTPKSICSTVLHSRSGSEWGHLMCVGEALRRPWFWPTSAGRRFLIASVSFTCGKLSCSDTVPTLNPVSSLFLIVKTLIVQSEFMLSFMEASFMRRRFLFMTEWELKWKSVLHAKSNKLRCFLWYISCNSAGCSDYWMNAAGRLCFLSLLICSNNSTVDLQIKPNDICINVVHLAQLFAVNLSTADELRRWSCFWLFSPSPSLLTLIWKNLKNSTLTRTSWLKDKHSVMLLWKRQLL